MPVGGARKHGKAQRYGAGLAGLLYMPMLRSKAGEALALKHLAASMKRHVFPIAHLTQFPPATFAAATAAWCGHGMALDGQFQSDMRGSTRSGASRQARPAAGQNPS